MRMHLTATKAYVLESIERNGPEVIGYDDKVEAAAAVRAWPHDTLVIGNCDNQENGKCKGHERG